MKTISFTRLLNRSVLIAAMVVLLIPTNLLAQPDRGDEKPENLQVLPETMTIQQVRRIMSKFNDALGVNCLYCHVGEPGQPPSTFDFASDDKEVKEVTRAMMRMSGAINNDHIQELPDGEDRVAVNCTTCHRGVAKPAMLEDVLIVKYAEDGVEETLAHYDELKAEHFGGFAYNFQDISLNTLAQRLLSMGESESALAFLKKNLELHPESGDTYALIGEAHLMMEDKEAAIMSLEKSIELNPRNRRAKARLEELKGGN